MHIVALLLESEGTNNIFCISLEWLNKKVFGKKIAERASVADLKNAFPCGSSNVQQRFSDAKK